MSTGVQHFNTAQQLLKYDASHDDQAEALALGRAAVHAQLATACAMATVARALERIADQGNTLTEDEQIAQVQDIVRPSDVTRAARARGVPADPAPDCACTHAEAAHADGHGACLAACGCEVYRVPSRTAAPADEPTLVDPLSLRDVLDAQKRTLRPIPAEQF